MTTSHAAPSVHVHTFTLRDADGVEHSYQTIAHPADEGERLFWALLALAGPSVGALAQAALTGPLLAEGGSLASIADRPISDLLEGVDFGAVGREVAAALSTPQALALSRDLLRHTTRDGTPLHNPAMRAQAYTRNYSEMVRALMEIVRFNRFFPLPGAS